MIERESVGGPTEPPAGMGWLAERVDWDDCCQRCGEKLVVFEGGRPLRILAKSCVGCGWKVQYTQGNRKDGETELDFLKRMVRRMYGQE